MNQVNYPLSMIHSFRALEIWVLSVHIPNFFFIIFGGVFFNLISVASWIATQNNCKRKHFDSVYEMFVSIVTAKGYLNIYNHSFQSHLSRFQTRFHNRQKHLCFSHAVKPLPASLTGTLSRDLALAFSYPVRVGAAHRPRGTPDRKSPSPRWDHAPKWSKPAARTPLHRSAWAACRQARSRCWYMPKE